MSNSRKKVLWADDEIEFLRAHILFLESRGYSVTAVFSGHDVVHLVKENPKAFDIVLLDEQMPGKDGLTTLEEIKAIAPDLPVVMVTKSEEEHVMEAALGKKIDGYLTKPVNPSQILFVCKRVLDSKQLISTQLSQKFVQSYSDIRLQLSTSMNAADWTRLYTTLTKWDLELEKVDNEGLRQSHMGQKSDCNIAFSEFVSEHYLQWLKGDSGAPVLSPQVIDTHLVPQLRNEKKVYFFVLDCMRLDQFMVIEPLLRKYFDIDRHSFYSILPTITEYSTASLFSGLFPADCAAKNPDVWPAVSKKNDAALPEKQFLQKKLNDAGLCTNGKGFSFVPVRRASDAKELLNNVDKYERDRLTAVSVDFMEMLTCDNSASRVLQEIAPDETAFRSLTRSWFQFSSVFAVLKKLALQDCTVILTAGYGSVFCTRAVDLYGGKITANGRYFCGDDLTCDERQALFISDPELYRLPKLAKKNCVLAKDNCYFVAPEKGKVFRQRQQNIFLYGGISMEEMIVPLAIMRPK